MSFPISKTISPRKYRAYDVGGQTVFPVYSGANGGLASVLLSVLFHGRPKVLDGGLFGIEAGLRSDEGGVWFVLTFTANDFLDGRAAALVEAAEQEMDAYLRGNEC